MLLRNLLSIVLHVQLYPRVVDSKNTYRKVKKAEGGIASAWLSTDCSRQPPMPRESSFRKVEKFGIVLVRFPPLLFARSERLPPAARARISRLRTVHAKWPAQVGAKNAVASDVALAELRVMAILQVALLRPALLSFPRHPIHRPEAAHQLRH